MIYGGTYASATYGGITQANPAAADPTRINSGVAAVILSNQRLSPIVITTRRSSVLLASRTGDLQLSPVMVTTRRAGAVLTSEAARDTILV